MAATLHNTLGKLNRRNRPHFTHLETQRATSAAAMAAVLALAGGLLGPGLGLAQAQSVVADGTSLTVYGLLDAGVRRDTQAPGQASTARTLQETQVFSGGMSNSYYGFKGAEDLGDGVSAVFDLQAGVAPTTGTSQQTTAIFDRRAALGLKQSGLGEVDLGRNTTFVYDQESAGVLDPLSRAFNSINESAVSYGGGKTGAIGGLINARVNPSNTLTSTAFATDRNNNMIKGAVNAGPLTFGLSYARDGGAGANPPHALGAEAAVKWSGVQAALTYQGNLDNNGRRADLVSVGAKYTWQDWEGQGAWQRLRVDDAYSANTTNALETVDTTGVVALVRSGGNALITDDLRVGDLAVSYHPIERLRLTAAWYRLDVQVPTKGSGHTNTEFLLAQYSLSKRTQVYAGLDAAAADSFLHGSKVSGRDTGITTGLQVRF